MTSSRACGNREAQEVVPVVLFTRLVVLPHGHVDDRWRCRPARAAVRWWPWHACTCQAPRRWRCPGTGLAATLGVGASRCAASRGCRHSTSWSYSASWPIQRHDGHGRWSGWAPLEGYPMGRRPSSRRKTAFPGSSNSSSSVAVGSGQRSCAHLSKEPSRPPQILHVFRTPPPPWPGESR